MHGFIRACLLALLAFVSAQAHATWPDTGWYWNPNEPGRGVAIEVQDDKVFLAIYTYDTGGAPIYYYAAGQMNDDHTYVGSLFRTSNGQCLGCSVRPATSTPVGTVSLSFSDYETATLSALGTTMVLTRFDFSNSNPANSGALFGEWATNEIDPTVSPPNYYAERITFNAVGTTAGTVTGTVTGSSANFAVGSCASRTACSIGVRDGPFDVYYLFSMAGFNRAEGLEQVVTQGAAPTVGRGIPFVMHRIRTGAWVRNGAGPAMTKERVANPAREAGATLKAEASRKAQPSIEEVARFSTPDAEAVLQRVAAALAEARAAVR